MNTVKKIEKILTSKFSISNYVDFLKEIFSNIKFIAPNKMEKEFSNFSSHIEASAHIGNYITPEDEIITLFAVQLKKMGYVKNSRSTQRSYAKKIIERANSEAAIIAFFTENDPKWRLSFVRLDYDLQMKEGKLKTVENITPAKRYSYLVGEEEPCHTAISRMRKFIMDNDSEPTLDELEEAFSVEKVTKEFFDLYCEKFHQIREHLESNEDFLAEAKLHNYTSVQFTKKLMGQIVFLYFLQKKGWLGVNAWPQTMNEKEYKNAYYARGQKSKQLIPFLYKLTNDGLYHLSVKALNSLSDEDAEELALCVKGRPWGTGPQTFMRQLFNFANKKNKNFFDEYLEPLFYDTLNRNRGEEGYCPALHCRIPFLSGGLFEPIDGYDWKNNKFNIPNEIFSNIKDEYDKESDGLLDVFDRYNFTMCEDEPMEREVAIDPEMLGKVFENLLEVNDRKSKAAFYTPREIVHHMCQESLINYISNNMDVEEEDIRDFILYGDLMKDEDTVKEKRQGNRDMYISENLFKIDDKCNITVNKLNQMDKLLEDVRIVDPAVGSGAFPLGMLNEIVKVRQNISAYMAINMNSFDTRMMYNLDRSPYSLKYETIKNSIFAADIDPSAVDITQLRLWLALVIDDEINPNATSILEGHRNPMPLPNLECNILCGNTLIDEFKGIPLVNQSEIINTSNDNQQQNIFQLGFDSILSKLIKEQEYLFKCDNSIKKKEILHNINGFKDSIVMSQLKGRASDKILKEYEESKNMLSKPYVLWQLDFAKVFFDKKGFDIVIGNPPYLGEGKNKKVFMPVQNTNFGKKYYIGKMDYWYFFTSKGIEILNDNGLLSFIAPNNWMTTAGGKNMRKHIMESCSIKRFINFGNYNVFDSANQQTMIFILNKNSLENEIYVQYKELLKSYIDKKMLYDFFNNKDCKVAKNYIVKIDREKYINGESIQFLDINIFKLINKIKNNKDNLYLKSTEITNGIHPHHACVTKKMLNILGDNFNVGDGIFVLNNDELKNMNLNEKEKKLLKPCYDTDSIGRYFFKKDKCKWIIYTDSSYKDKSKLDIYPNIKLHLDKYIDVITSDNKPYGLHRARKKEFFDGEKIVSLRKCSIPTFSYIEEDSYVLAKWYVIKTSRVDMKYLTGILNSKLVAFWLKYMGKLQGDNYQIDKEPLLKIPICVNKKYEREIIDLVCKIMKTDGKENYLEKNLNRIIYKLYNLNENEIKIIEENISLK